MTIDLKAMSRKELEKLLGDVNKALVSAQNRDRREAKKAAEKAAAEFGFSLADLAEAKSDAVKPLRKKRKTSSKPSLPQFANPADRSQTWTGKGRQPNWFRVEIDKGTSREAMKI